MLLQKYGSINGKKTNRKRFRIFDSVNYAKYYKYYALKLSLLYGYITIITENNLF